MKYLNFLLIFFLFSFFTVLTYGQTDRGKIIVGGSSALNFSSTSLKLKSDDDNQDAGKSTNFEFSPQVGYFIADGFALGVEIPVSFTSQKDEDDHKYSTSSIAFAPFARYYFGKTNIKPYLHGSLGIGSMNFKNNPREGTTENSSNGMFLYQMGGGVGVFLKENISLDLGLSYSSIRMKPKEDNDNNYRIITSGINLNVGISIFF